MKSHRVLLLNESSSEGAVEGRTLELARALHDESISALILGSPGSHLARLSRVYKVPFRPCALKGSRGMEGVFEVWRRVQHFRPSVVHAITGQSLLTASLALHLAGKHQPGLVAEADPGDHPLLPCPLTWAFRQCQGVLLNAPSHRSEFTDRVRDFPGRMLTVRFGLRPAPVQPRPLPFSAPLRIGLLGFRNGEDIQTLHRLLTNRSQVELSPLPPPTSPGPAGSWPTPTPTPVPFEECLGECLGRFDICVLAAPGGGLHLAHLPILATPLPVLAERCPENLELLRDNASLFSPGDLRTLAKLIDGIIEDPSLWVARALERATRIRQRFARELLLQSHLAAYEAVT